MLSTYRVRHAESTHICRRASDVAMGALAYFTARAERACPSAGMPPLQLRQAVGAGALEDLLLWLSAYRYVIDVRRCRVNVLLVQAQRKGSWNCALSLL